MTKTIQGAPETTMKRMRPAHYRSTSAQLMYNIMIISFIILLI